MTTIKVELTGHNGNAFTILSRCLRAMRRAKMTTDEIERFQAEATAGDYNHLLRTCTEWFDVR